MCKNTIAIPLYIKWFNNTDCVVTKTVCRVRLGLVRPGDHVSRYYNNGTRVTSKTLCLIVTAELGNLGRHHLRNAANYD